MNRTRMTSKMLDLHRAGKSYSLVLMRRSLNNIKEKEKKEKMKDLLSPSSIRKLWNKTGVQLKGGKACPGWLPGSSEHNDLEEEAT